MPSGVRLEGSESVEFADAPSSNCDITNSHSSIGTLLSAKPTVNRQQYDASPAALDDCNAKMGCSQNLETSSCSPSPIMRGSPHNMSRQESLSNNSQHICHTTADQESTGSPISLNYCSSPDSSPIEGSPTAFRSYHSNILPGLLPLHPALQLQSSERAIRSFPHIPRLPSFPLASTSSKYYSVVPPLPEVIQTNKMTQVFEMAHSPNQQPSPKSNVRNVAISKSPSPESVNTTTTTQHEENSSISATPHGIENILSRPLPRPAPVTSSATQQQSSTSSQYPPFPGLPQTQNSLDFPSGINNIGLHSSTFSGIYWPSLQSFIDNPALQSWRDRFQMGKKYMDITFFQHQFLKQENNIEVVLKKKLLAV